MVLAAQDDGTTGTDDLPGFVCHLRKQSLDIGYKWLNKLRDNGDGNDSVVLDLIAEVAKKAQHILIHICIPVVVNSSFTI